MTFSRSRQFIITLLLLLCRANAARGADEIDVKETPLGSTRHVLIRSLTPSPDGKRLAYAAAKGKSIELFTDGKPDANEYQGVADKGIAFSPDSRHVAFLAQTQGKWVVVVDGMASPPFNTFAKGSFTFNATGTRWLVTADESGKRLLLLDNQPGKPYDDILHPHFSPDGQRVAYAARVGTQWFAVIDGVPSAPCDALLDGNILFSPDSKRAIYAAKTPEKWSIVTGSGEPKTYDGVAPGTLAFSPDGARWAVAVSREGRWFILDAGVEGKPFDRITDGSVAFSPDGKHLAYVAEQNGKMQVIHDGVEEAPFDSIDSTPLFGAGMSHLAYVARNAKESMVVVDAKPVGTYEKVPSPPFFSDDGNRLAFVAIQGRRTRVIVDGKEAAECDEVLQPPLFSPDGKRLAFAIRRGHQQMAVIDGVEGTPAQAVGRIAFSPDSKHVAYGAQADGNLHLVCDTAATGDYGGFIHGAALVFDGDSSFNTLVFRDNDLLGLHAAFKTR